MGLGNSEVRQEQSHGLASHRAATVRVKGELVWFNVLLATALGDEALGKRGTFSVSQHPANHVAGEDVEDDVEVVWATLLDEGIYYCSIRTMYRILEEYGEVRERRNRRRHPNYTKPELLAEAPNQVWSWDITKLRGPVKWTY